MGAVPARSFRGWANGCEVCGSFGTAGPLKVVIKVNGQEVASGVVPVSAPLRFTANDCLDFGVDLGSPVGIEYYNDAPFKFNGAIENAQVRYLGTPAQIQKEAKATAEPNPVTD